ncbi:MAG: acyltransferase [Gemmatimonadaceae bacterium]
MSDSAPRYCALDGLRGAAALLVVLYHIGWANHITGGPFVRNGYLAVDLFFILSGFVIATNYANRLQSRADVLAFFRLRFFRLYPLHFALLAAFVLLEVVKLLAQRYFGAAPGIDAPFAGQNSYAALAANIVLVQAWHLFPSYSYNGPSWSISCEVGAYLLFALTAYAGLLRHHLAFVVGLLLSVACYVILADSFHTARAAVTWGVPRAAAGFWLGVLLWRYRPASIASLSGAAQSLLQLFVVIGVVATMTAFSGAAVVWVIPMFVVLIASLLSDRGVVARVLRCNPLQALGRWSYSIYMVHMLVLVCLSIAAKHLFHLQLLPTDSAAQAGARDINAMTGDVLVAVVLVVVFGLSIATYRLIEEPGRQYGRRRWPRPDVALRPDTRRPRAES